MPGENLTRDEAIQRRATIDTHSYKVSIDLTSGPDTFLVDTEIYFDAKPGSSTFVDLIAERVFSISLNGLDLDAQTIFKDSRIDLQGLAAKNVLQISSEQRYMNTGEGLHRFVDPADGEVYLYSQFEVPDARRMFPVFEQPDLKATFQFTVTAPARWKVVSVQPTPTPTMQGLKDGEEIATWEFTPTPIMSSYITALIAGPYHEVRSELTNTDGRVIPLGVFCRESLAPHLDAEYIFEKTRQGFKFFGEEFNYPYPFEKYDQLFVPEYNAGAMENIGAVTFTEAYVFRSKVTDAMRERRVVTILHELAHMWFGDLVTMRWWNDLWLNESFAEYMSILATAEVTEWKDAWSTFVASEKTWAYRQDQLPSTHPIVAEINDLDDVMVNFDGITYAKGASVLKQLVAWVGQKDFMRGVHNYFVKHAYGNTELTDLLSELENTSGRELGEWSKLWLETAGVNTLAPTFETDSEGNFTSFSILQSANKDYPTLRPHRIAVGLYEFSNADKLELVKRIELDINGAETFVPDLVGVKQPDLILLNDGDLSYAKLRFDDRSLKTVTTRLRDISDPLARALVWGAMWDATRDAQVRAGEFIDLVLNNISAETNSTMMRTLLNQLTTAAKLYSAPKKRDQAIDRIALTLWGLAQEAKAGSDAQFQFLKTFAALAQAPEHAAIVEDLLDEKVTLDGLDIDKDLGWELLIALTANGIADADLIERTLATDFTATGQQSAAHAKAAIGTPESKAEIWNEMVATAGPSNLLIRHAALGFMRVRDHSLLEPYIDLFFLELEEIWETRSFAISEEIIDGFYPMILVNEKLRSATARWLAENVDASSALRRYMIENLADVDRALEAQTFDASGS